MGLDTGDSGESGTSLQDWGHMMVPPGPTNPPPPPDPTPPPVPVIDVSQTTWGQPRPSSFGIREVTGVPLWVSDPHVSHVTTLSNVTTTATPGPTAGPGGLTSGGLGSDPGPGGGGTSLA